MDKLTVATMRQDIIFDTLSLFLSNTHRPTPVITWIKLVIQCLYVPICCHLFEKHIQQSRNLAYVVSKPSILVQQMISGKERVQKIISYF